MSGYDPNRAPAESTFGGGLLDNAYTVNNDAINAYFHATEAVTDEAKRIKSAFVAWYDGLTWIGKGLESNYDLARNQRNQFNLANATTPEEKANVTDVITTGLSTEQLNGQTDRRDTNGMLPGPVAPPKPPLIPNEYLIAGAAVAGLAIIAGAYGYGRK